MSLTNTLFKAARFSADARALTSGSPRRIATRGKNKIVGRTLAKAGFWSFLWRKL